MRIHSIKLTNYRIHREFEATFDPSLTLVGGPNESGKSTLADAAYNALFMRAKKGGSDRDNILSRHGGHPGVELNFECSGRTYTVRKSFRGQQGTIVLSQHGGETWNAEAAEEKLLELCGIGADEAGGKAIPRQWEHLWVRQGQAGNDPSAFATGKKETLLSRLQGSGAAAIFQSPTDSRVAGELADELADVQTARGSKAGSELDNAAKAAAAASKVRQSAEIVSATLDKAVADFEQSTRELADADRNLSTLQADLVDVRQKLARAGELRSLLDQQKLAATNQNAEFQRLAAGDQSIRDITSLIAADASRLAPIEASLASALEEESSARKAHAEAEKAHAESAQRSSEARARLDLSALCVKSFEQSDILNSLKTRNGAAQVLRTELAALPSVSAGQLTNLQNLDIERGNLAAALAAISTRIEIIESDLPVEVDGASLSPGQHLEFSNDTEIRIGTGVQIRITPGGGTSLAEMRLKFSKTEAEFQEALGTLGVGSVTEAVAAKTARDEILVRLEGTESIAQELADADSRLVETTEEILRSSTKLENFTPPSNAAEAAAMQAAFQVENETAAEAATSASHRLKTCFENFEAATKSVASLRSELNSGQKTLEGIRGQLTQLVFAHGEEFVRTARLTELANAKQIADAELAVTQESFNALQPQVLEDDETRIVRAISRNQSTKTQAGECLAVAKNTLRREGTNDPVAELARAAASERSAIDRLASAKRNADALVLLNSLFSAEQQSLTDQLTKPLADKVSGYLQCLFGPLTEVRVTITDGEFDALTLNRPASGTFSFSELSGGAQEQAAIAFRLAMAEVLAQEHDGCLPVFLDDAFTNSDPTRVALLQRMLDLAASRGLQIIALSCTPNDYASLGAMTVMLQPPSALCAAEATAPANWIEDQASEEFDETVGETGVNVTEDRRQEFLQALSASEDGRAGNGKLRDSLGWDEATYNAVKNQLVASGMVLSGKGRGGSVSLPET